MNEENIKRLITLFQQIGDDFVGEVELTKLEFEKIREMLGFSSSDLMYDCYPLTGNVLAEVKNLLKGKLLEGDFEYYLETEAA